MEIKLPPGVPDTEYSREFIQGMVDRMGISFFKYGAVAVGFPHKVNALDSMAVRLDNYHLTHNTEYLIDAANFAMIEFMRPSYPNATYRPTDTSGSPGRVFNGEINPVQDPNVPKRQ